jgi:Ca2+-binding RTX toxin-like protein
MPALAWSLFFAGSTSFGYDPGDGSYGPLGGGPLVGFTAGPSSITVDWGAPDAQSGDPSPFTYPFEPSGESYVDWNYTGGTHVVLATGSFPGGEIALLRFTVTIDVTETAAVNRVGTSLPDFIMGGAGNDSAHGSGGDDWLLGHGGGDRLTGGAGNDWLRAGEDDGADTMVGGEGDDSCAGYGGDDNMRGGNGADALFGHEGADRLYGDAGADQLTGGAGRDTITCGVDSDSDWLFYYGVGEILDGADFVSGFTPGTDRIALNFLRGLGVDETRFVGNAAAIDEAGGWIIYNAARGLLTVDLNGTDAGERYDVAIFAGAPAIGFDDLLGF